MKYIFCVSLILLVILNGKSQDLLPYRVDTLWGYKDRQNVIRIEPQFQYAAKFRGSYAIVTKHNKLGAIDKSNNLIIPFHYEFLRQLDTTEFLFGYRAKYVGEYSMGVLTNEEKIKIPAEYNYISTTNGAYLVTKNKDTVIGKNAVGDVRSITSSYGLFDRNGNVLIPCKYAYISWVNDSLIDVTASESKNNHALFNRKGEQLTGFEYMVFGKFIEGVAKARIDDKYGFIYPNGHVAIPIQFEYCEDFSDGHALIKRQNKWGAINKSGQLLIEPTRDYQEVKKILKETYDRP